MPRRSTGSYSVGIARREAILAAAVRHFAKGGYHKTAMGRIAADVGITEGGLLHHFPSKKHLLLAVVERRILAAEQSLDEAPGVTGTGVLRRLLEITARQLGEPGLIELFVLVSAEAADTSSPAHRLFAERYDNAVENLAARLRQAVDSGEFRAGTDCTAVARDCIAVNDGLQLQWLLSGGKLDLVAAARAHLDRLARDITADGRGLDG